MTDVVSWVCRQYIHGKSYSDEEKNANGDVFLNAWTAAIVRA